MPRSLPIINVLKNSGRLNMTIFLVVMSLICVSLSLFRYIISDRMTFLFLNWNLFLAFIPWLVTTITIVKKKTTPLYALILILVWILFFPNSPYILTDLFHLRSRIGAPLWFDLIVILSYAWTGLIFGFVSLMDIESILRKKMSPYVVTALSSFFLFLSAFGVYLGRYLRWNSWDIALNPFGLFNDIIDRFANPLDHPRTWGMTIFMGILLNMMYFSIMLLKDMNEKRK